MICQKARHASLAKTWQEERHFTPATRLLYGKQQLIKALSKLCRCLANSCCFESASSRLLACVVKQQPKQLPTSLTPKTALIVAITNLLRQYVPYVQVAISQLVGVHVSSTVVAVDEAGKLQHLPCQGHVISAT
jgi:hypothetical protein